MNKKKTSSARPRFYGIFQGFPPLPPKKPGIEANPSIGFSCGLKGIEGPGTLHEEGSVQCVPSVSQAKSWGCKRGASKYRYKSLEKAKIDVDNPWFSEERRKESTPRLYQIEGSII